MATNATVITREAFVVGAVEQDDVRLAQQYFQQPEVLAEVERVNAFFLARDESVLSYLADGPTYPWYFTQPPGEYFRSVGPRSLVFYTAMEKQSIAFLQWLFAPHQVTLMGVTLAALLREVALLAADGNHLEVLELLLASEVFTAMLSDDQQQQLLFEMLCTAVERRHEDAMELLVAHGAPVNDSREETLFISASMGTERSVDVLVANGAFVTGADVLTSLSEIGSARQLLKHGAVCRALHDAAEAYDGALVLLYLQHGFADVDALDHDGATAFELALRHWSSESPPTLENMPHEDPITILLRYGAKLP